jgi:hypothetical protein
MSRGLFTPTPEVLAKLAPHLGITKERLFEEAGWLNAHSVGAEPPQQREGTLRSIELTEDVYQALLKLVRSFEDTPCDVLRRLLGLHEADEHDS